MIAHTLTLANVTGATSGADSDSQTLTRNAKNLIGRITATENSGSATLDAKIEHSPTGATGTWKTLIAFTTLSASGVEDVHYRAIDGVIWPCVRASTTITGTGDWTYKIDLGMD